MNNLENFLVHHEEISMEKRCVIYNRLLTFIRDIEEPLSIFFQVVNITDLYLKKCDTSLNK